MQFSVEGDWLGPAQRRDRSSRERFASAVQFRKENALDSLSNASDVRDPMFNSLRKTTHREARSLLDADRMPHGSGS